MAAPHSSPSGPISSEDTKIYACIICVQRKVKCDKRQPCLACVKSRLQCKYRTTPPPKRRKRKIENSNQALLDIMRSHEATLRNAGLPFETFDDSIDGADDHDEGDIETAEAPRGRSLPVGRTFESSSVTMQTSLPHRGILVSEHGGTRYYEHGLIGALGQEYRQNSIHFVNQHCLGDTVDAGAQESQQDASDILRASVLMGSPSTLASPQSQHPPAASVMKYWSIFVANVHPLTKVVHAPSVYQMMVDGPSNAPMNTDALRYSIYACAVASLTENECQKDFGESQASLLYAFQSATRHALSESSFLRVPDIDLLRAHVLFLTSMFHTSDPSSLWILMGSAIRIAQSQGLHRDGAVLGLPPFEAEMRRRLWWYIVTLDGRLAELTGSESSLPKSMDTSLPANLNDSQLRPDMTILPKGRTGASDMTFCLLKYEIARFMQEHDPRLDGFELKQLYGTEKPGEKRNVSELESFLEEKFLRFCDPVIPVQFLTTTLARSTLCKLRQMEHRKQSRPNPDDEGTTSSELSRRTLNIAARNLEYDNLIHSNKTLRGFLWHVHFYFPWGSPTVILKILASRPDWDDDMQAAWARIEELHENHPEYREDNKVIHLVVGGLTLKAWATQEADLGSRGMPKKQTPAIIAPLQARQAAFSSRYKDPRTAMMGAANDEINFIDMSGFDSFELADAAFDGTDWSYWGIY